jgi:flagellar assembly protein FliH
MMPLSDRVISAEQARHFQAWHTREFDNPGSTLRNAEAMRRKPGLAGGMAAEERKDPLQESRQQMAAEREALDLRIAALRDWENKLNERSEALDARERNIGELENNARVQGEEKGRCQGYAEGWASAEKERNAWMNLNQAVSNEFQSIKEGLAQQCLKLGVEIAKKVVLDSIALETAPAAKLLKKLHEEISDDLEKITLVVNPSQLEWFAKQVPDLPHFAGARLVADATVHAAGFKLQHSEGGLDCSLDKRWKRALSAIGIESEEGLAP